MALDTVPLLNTTMEIESQSCKRSHTVFSADLDGEENRQPQDNNQPPKKPKTMLSPDATDASIITQASRPKHNTSDVSVLRLTDGSPNQGNDDRSTLSTIEVVVTQPTKPPQATDMSSDAVPQPAKKPRTRLTPAEKAAKEQKELELKTQKELERKQKAEAREAEKEAKAREREQKKLQKQEEERKARESKERAQPSIVSFFTGGRGKPVITAEDGADSAITEVPAITKSGNSSSFPQKPELAKSSQKNENMSEFDRMNFKPFYVKKYVKLAQSRFSLSSAQKELRMGLMDSVIPGRSAELAPAPFDPVKIFGAKACENRPRGISYPSVRSLMKELDLQSYTSTAATLMGSSKTAADVVAAKIKSIPIKWIEFAQDPRPAYCGTVSSVPAAELRRMARRPCSRFLPSLNYDYASEDEWIDDGEDGENLNDLSDEDDEADGDEDMGGFLDDSEDACVTLMRMPLSGDLEPVSSGICWENTKGVGPLPALDVYRIEFLHPLASPKVGISPFSTAYWGPPAHPSKRSIAQAPTACPGTALADGRKGAGTKDGTGTGAVADTEAEQILKTLSGETINKIKDCIVKFSNINRIGLVNILASEVSEDLPTKKLGKLLTLMADQSGPAGKKVKKTWVLRERFSK